MTEKDIMLWEHDLYSRNSQHNIRHNMDSQIITAHGKIITAQK